MGIYSGTRIGENYGYPDFEVATNENYDCTTGVAMALIDIQQNDLALFEAAICSDMGELSAMNEGYEVINEAASDIFKKIKELFLKLIEKIKGIFKAFMAKFNGIFMDCKQLYNKYNKTIAKNTNWKNFKVKDFRDKKSAYSNKNILEAIEEVGTYAYKTSGQTDNLYEFADFHGDQVLIGSIKASEVYDKDNHIDAEDITDALITARFSSALKDEVSDSGDLNDINKGFLDVIFEDAESKDGDDDWSTSDILHGVIGDILQEGDKNTHKIEQGNNKLEGTLKSLVNKVDKEAQKVIKAVSNMRLGKDAEYTQTSVKLADAGQRGRAKKSATATSRVVTGAEDNKMRRHNTPDSQTRKFKSSGKEVKMYDNDTERSTTTAKNLESMENIERLAGFYQRCATTEQTLVTKITGARLNAIKFAVGQARKIWSSAAAYASVDHKNESYEYYTAVGEAVLYDYETDIQAPVY